MRTARALSRLTGCEVDDHPYDRGYWSRIVGDPRPDEYFAARGWDHANRELAAKEPKEEN